MSSAGYIGSKRGQSACTGLNKRKKRPDPGEAVVHRHTGVGWTGLGKKKERKVVVDGGQENRRHRGGRRGLLEKRKKNANRKKERLKKARRRRQPVEPVASTAAVFAAAFCVLAGAFQVPTSFDFSFQRSSRPLSPRSSRCLSRGQRFLSSPTSLISDRPSTLLKV